MQIQVHLAEPFWRTVGKRDIQIKLGKGATLRALLSLLSQQYPGLTTEIEEMPSLFFVGGEIVEMETPLKDGDKVNIVWPIAGG